MYPRDYKTGDEDDCYPDTRGAAHKQDEEDPEQDTQSQDEDAEYIKQFNALSLKRK